MFATQLNALCARSEPPVTNVMLAKALADRGCKVSKPYLSQLRTRVRADPAAPIVEALADYFGIATDFFFTPSVTVDAIASAQADIETLQYVENAALSRLLAYAQGLSVVSLNLLIDFADRLRVIESLPRVSADSHIYT